MSESKIKLLILTWPRLGPEELLSHLEAGLGRSCRGRHFGAPRSSGAGACAIPSLGLLIDLTEVAASVTMALMALAASAAGGSAPVSCCAPASSKTPVVRYCHEIRGSFLCVHTGSTSCSVQSHSKGTASPPPPTVNSPPVARCSSEQGTEVLFVLSFALHSGIE